MTITVQLADERSYEALDRLAASEARIGPGLVTHMLKQRDRALQALSVMAETVSTQLSVDAVLQRALDQALDTLEVEAGAITLLEEGDNPPSSSGLVFRVQKGWKIHDFVQDEITLKPDEGLAGIVMQTQKPVVTKEVTSDPRIVVKAFREEPVKAMILAPMRARGRVKGLLSVMSYRPRRFTIEEVALLAAIADQIGVAVDNARLYELEQERGREMAALYEITRSINRTLLLEDVLQDIVASVCSVLDARACYIALLEDEAQGLIVRAAAGVDPDWKTGARMNIGEGVVGQVAQTGQSCYIPDVQGDILSPGDTSSLKPMDLDPSVRSLMVIPLTSSQREVIGTLSVDSKQFSAFSQADTHLITVAASQASIAIENARLYEDLAQRNKTLDRAYHELKKFAELREQFVQNISHELRTPMTYVRGYVELLADESLGPLNEEQVQTLNLVMRKTDEVVLMINETVALQPLILGKLQRSPINVQDLLHQTAASFREDILRRGVHLRLGLVDPHIQIYGDPERLEQLCQHILENAVKFSYYGGEISVDARYEDGLVHLIFKDQGIGIPSDQLNKIFDTFYQLDNMATRRFAGLGIGLSTVRRIAEAHEGMVWAESEEGQGSTFHVLLPRYIPPGNEEEEANG
jgi:signal transduction histidine kinase